MKTLTLFALFLLFLQISNAQYQYTQTSGTGNPGILNQETDINLTGWSEITFSSGTTSTNNWSNSVSFPADFKFLYMHGFRTSFQVSKNGCINMWAQGYLPTYSVPGNNTTTPPTAPRNLIAVFWDQFTANAPLGTDDKIYYKIFGTSPNRQLWVKWYSYELNTASWTYFACVFEENLSNIYMVDYKYNSGGSALTGTIGIWDYENGDLVSGSPNLTLATGTSEYTDNKYYKFSPIAPYTPDGTTLTVDPDGCGVQTLTRKSNYSLADGEIYYWQGNSCGTSKADSSYTYEADYNGTFYIRAYNYLTNKWSSSCQSIEVFDYKPRAPYPYFTVSTNLCGTKTLTRTSSVGDIIDVSGIDWQQRATWQGTTCGNDEANENSSYLVNSSGTYNLRGWYEVLDIGIYPDCWSSCNAQEVTYNPYPSTPPAIDVSTNSCGDKTLTRNIPPAGTTYYWQTSSSGTSTANSSLTYTVTSTGTYYLRAKTDAGCWSTSATSAAVTVNPIPGIPSVPTVSSNLCGNKTVYKGVQPSQVSYFWQTSLSGTSKTDSLSYLNISNSGTLYLRAVSNAGCWSSSASLITLTVNAIPATPTSFTISSTTCGSKTLTRTNPPGGVTYYWQTEKTGESTFNSSSENPASSSGKYYLRARTLEGCWSDSSYSKYVNVNVIPSAPPVPTYDNADCGEVTLNAATPPANVTYYWQTSSGGLSKTNSNTTNLAAVSGTYYIKACSDSGCWSSSTSVSLNVYEIPAAPSKPVVSTNECGDKTISRTNPPYNVLYYWQTDSLGTSIGNSVKDLILTSSSTYFLRAKTLDAGCWSDSSVSVNVIVKNPYTNDHICLITVDPQTGSNLVVWEKTANKNTSNYILYRQTNQTNVFQALDTLSFNDTTVYADLTSQHENRSEVYKVTVIDSCGQQSNISLAQAHKTIFLQYNGFTGGVNLKWSPYQINGSNVDFMSFIIYRGTDSLALAPFDTIAGNIYEYTDTDPVASKKLVWYRVSGLKADECNPVQFKLKISSGPFSQSLSNLEDNRLKNLGLKNTKQNIANFEIYPNPVNNNSRIYFNLIQNAEIKVSIIASDGRLINVLVNDYLEQGHHSYDIDENNLSEGVYRVIISVNGILSAKSFVKN